MHTKHLCVGDKRSNLLHKLADHVTTTNKGPLDYVYLAKSLTHSDVTVFTSRCPVVSL